MKHSKKEKDKDKDNSDIENKKAEKINQDDNYLSYNVLKEILTECKIPKRIIEEKNSELFYETLTGKGNLTFINKMRYHGLMKNGLLESGPNNEKCQIIFADGTKYEGEIHQNKITGNGKYIFPSGSIYEGSLLNGLRHGIGKFESPEGITYEGEWKNGLKDGKGIMKRDTMTYEGDWKEGRINGLGKITWKNGNLYDGHFKLNHIDGDGFMIWYDLLEKYIGKWKNDKQNGFGMNIWYEPKGEMKEMRNRYVGEWEDGIKQGYGIFFYSNGAIYEGEWKNNMKHGFGVMVSEDGKKYIGRFEEDRILDRDNQLNLDEVKKLMKQYELDKINNLKNNEENKEKVNNINNIYQIIQNKKNPSQDLNQSNISNKKKDQKKLAPTPSNKNNSKGNTLVNSKEISRIGTIKEKSAIAEEDNNNLRNSSLRAINNVSSPSVDKNINSNVNSVNRENKKENTNNNNNASPTNNNSNHITPMNKTNSSLFNPNKLPNLESFQKQKNILGAILNSKAPIFIPYFDLSDLIQEDPSISNDLEEISKVILRNLSILKLIYRYLNRLANSKAINEDTNSSKLISRNDHSKHMDQTNSDNNLSVNRSHSRKKSSILNKSTNKKLKQMMNPPIFNIIPNKLKTIEDSIRSDELSFCISMLDVWDFLRDRGILNEKASICQFDRIFALGNNTITENFLLPEDLNEPVEIYKYIYKKIGESKNNFVYKYKNYFEYYYRDSKIPKSIREKIKKNYNIENKEKNNNDNISDKKEEFILEKIHDKRRVILPRIFQECLIRAAMLIFSWDLVKVLVPGQYSSFYIVFNTTKSGILENTIVSDNLTSKATVEVKDPVEPTNPGLIIDVEVSKAKIGDKTILYSEFYYKIVLYKFEDGKENLIRKLVPSKFSFVDLITNYFKDKTNLNSEENRKDCTKLYDYFHSLLNREMIEFEFNELIFLICRKYINIRCLRGTFNEYKEVITEIENIVNKLEKPKNTRKKYFYPTLQSHITKQRLIDEEKRRIEEEMRRKKERQRYLRERELMDKEEKVNAFNDKIEEEEDESEEDIEEDLF